MDQNVAEALQKAQDVIASLNHDLANFLAEPLVHATVIGAKNNLDPGKFENNDLVLITDGSNDDGRTARIIGRGTGNSAVENGVVEVIFPDLRRRKYYIGLNGKRPQVKLLGKDDGTNVTICVDGTPMEVHGVFGHTFTPGQAVKVNINTRQIVEVEGWHGSGEVAFVKSILDQQHVEVDLHGSPRIVLNGKPGTLIEANDRVQLDRSQTVIIRHLGRECDERHQVNDDLHVSWDDIGGCEDAKMAMLDLFELPYLHPEVYKYYNKKIPAGALLYGPPGCGKAQPLSSIVYTPTGPVKMGSIIIGQKVCTPDGRIAQVLDVFPQGEVDIYRITFSDDSYADCTLDPVWL
jgi:hypothetical protein